MKHQSVEISVDAASFSYLKTLLGKRELVILYN